MRLIRPLGILALTLLLFSIVQALRPATPTHAYSANGTIAVPGGLASMDIFWGDATLREAFDADRTNAAIDVYNMSTDTFVGRIPVPAPGSPNGVFTDSARALVFYGNLNSTFYVASATTLQNIGSVSTGGTGRADEGAYDPRDQIAAIANDQDNPPFVSFINVANPAAPTIIAQIRLPQATNGFEQTVWVPQTGQFMSAIPSISGGTGAIAIFTVGAGPTVTQTGFIPLDCTPAGMALANYPLMFVGCNPAPEVVNIQTGKKVATLGNQPSSDEVWFDRGANAYEFLSGTAPLGQLNIYSAATNALVETDAIPSGFHNLTADAVTQQVFVALRPPSNVCANGCIAVFANPAVGLPGGAGVTCNGVVYSNATTCGTFGSTAGTGVVCSGVPYPNATTCGTFGTLGGTGVTCAGVFYPNATNCGSFAGSTAPAGPLPIQGGAGVTCSGTFYPSATTCGKTS
jgi:hypothetical protein